MGCPLAFKRFGAHFRDERTMPARLHAWKSFSDSKETDAPVSKRRLIVLDDDAARDTVIKKRLSY